MKVQCLINFNFKLYFLSVFVILLIGFSTITLFQFFSPISVSGGYDIKSIIRKPTQWQKLSIPENGPKSPSNHSCNFFNCFNVYRCGRSGSQKLSVYVYPPKRYFDEKGNEVDPYTKEFTEILTAVSDSEYYTPNPSEACLFVPAVDTLNEQQININLVENILPSLPHWSSGENHILFNFLPGAAPDFGTSLGLERGKAMIAGAGFSSFTYRPGFDVSLPVYNPLHQHIPPSTDSVDKRPWLLISSQGNIHRDHREDLEAQVGQDSTSRNLLLLDNCKPFNVSRRCRGSRLFGYPQILSRGKFCLIVRGGRLGQTALYDAMRAGCVPVVAADSLVLPFADVVDWRDAALRLYEEELPEVVAILEKNVSHQRLAEMQKQVIWLYETYFSSLGVIVATTLRIINDRVFPAKARSLARWNERPRDRAPPPNPLFLPRTAPASDGFTAVVLTYDRIASAFQVVENLSKVPSLAKILVVWNNQLKKPPPASSWPNVHVPLEVIEPGANRLSNRFRPYPQIRTEAILAIDDDINMMTADELQFGYNVWREFPDRIVGFPSRNVVWNNATDSWRYDSEWTNEVSMVLTGVSFYHKYWSYVYSTELPEDVKDWVDSRMNCEDIAMNFLVANKTGKAPIKVTPRKKFKCGECASADLSGNAAHLQERSECVNRFSRAFGQNPLKTVEFRADPVLFKQNLPDKVKMYTDIGSL